MFVGPSNHLRYTKSSKGFTPCAFKVKPRSPLEFLSARETFRPNEPLSPMSLELSWPMLGEDAEHAELADLGCLKGWETCQVVKSDFSWFCQLKP